jgi:hypothetical protein
MNNRLSFQITEHKKDHGVGNPRPGLGQAWKCGRVKLVNGSRLLYGVFFIMQSI